MLLTCKYWQKGEEMENIYSTKEALDLAKEVYDADDIENKAVRSIGHL